MNAASIQAILAIVLDLLPKITNSASVANVITLLENWMPVIVQFFQSEIPVVENIINTLKASDATLPAQRATLDALLKSSKTDWDAAYTAAKADEAAFQAGN